MSSLFEKYRPTKWSEVVAQDKAVNTLKRIVANGAGGRAYFIQGSSGTGKTSIARILASELAEEFCIEELDAGEVTEAHVRELAKSVRHKSSFSKPGRVVIINEIHRAKRGVIGAFLTALEPIPAHAAWIFTTTSDGAETLFDDVPDANPFGSRCLPISLSRRGLAEQFAQRAMDIAKAEGLDGGQSLDAFVRLAKECRNNLRMMLSNVEAGCMLS